MIKFNHILILVGLSFFIFNPLYIFGQEVTVQDLQKKIITLEQIINVQAGRIVELEKKVNYILSNEPTKQKVNTFNMNKSNDGWQKESNWSKIKNGMSERQVVAILGKPTSTKMIADIYKTLFYKGEILGSGFVSGNIELQNDRVWAVNIPVF